MVKGSSAPERVRDNLYRRGGVYYARVTVPTDVRGRPRPGKDQKWPAELWISLRTKEPTQACDRRDRLLIEMRRAFDLTRGIEAQARPPEATARAFYREMDRQAAEYRAEMAGDPDAAEMLRLVADQRDQQIAKLKRRLGTGDLSFADAVADELARRERYRFAPNSPDERTFKKDVAAAIVATMEREAGRDRGETVQPTLALVRDGTGEAFAVLHATYVRQLTGVSADWLYTHRLMGKLFASHVGAHRAIDAITARDIRDYRNKLQRFPARATLRETDGDTLDTLIAKNEVDGKPTLAANSINKQISALNGFFQWCVEQGHVETNPATGMSLKAPRGESVDPLTVPQLKALFAAPLFTGCASDSHAGLYRPGNVQVRDWRFWAPLIGAFSGARLAEILQLTALDITERDGVTLLSINDVGDKKLKTRAARRVVPVHSELERIGFLRFVDDARAVGRTLLFPGIEPDAKGSVSNTPSKFFARLLTSVKIKDGRRQNFHSLRHSFTDALRTADVATNDIALIVGHEAKTVTHDYGKEAVYGPARRKLIIEKVAYPGLDLKRLYLK